MSNSRLVVNTAEYLISEARDRLEESGYQVVDRNFENMTETEFCTAIKDVHAIVASGERYTNAVFEAANVLDIVARTGAGVDQVDLEAASHHGVWVTNTPGATTPAVADFALGLILCLLRDLPAMNQDMKRGIYERHTGQQLNRMTVGVVGAGLIGKDLIKRVSACGAKVLAYDVYQDDAFAAQWHVSYVDLDQLMAESDVVTLHCALTDQTHGLIDERRLGLMKSSAYLVNTSRGPVVDRSALFEILHERRIAGAAIDAHDQVPTDPDDPLIQLDNVIATPHTAYRTQDAINDMCNAAVADIIRVLSGESPRFPVNQLPG